MKKEYDVIVIGTGAAGLYGALQFDPSVSVLLISKRELTLSNSSLAQGGVAAVLDLEHDDYKLHFEDTMIAGGRKNDPDAVNVLVTEGPDNVLAINRMGVDFDRDPDGSLQKTLEAGHSRRRIVHHKDSTGKAIVDQLIEEVKKRPNVEIAENTLVFSLEKAEHGFFAGILRDGSACMVGCRYCLLATGGIGRVYQYTTNSAIATGDGITLAYELGARIKNLRYVQFHPTAFAAAQGRERFLISEAVRGEGALLLNCDKERFMSRYDKRGELAPRDVVSRSIMKEAARTGSEDFYLDIRFRGEAFIKNHFPMIYQRCLEEGVDITKECIPVFPCQHYLMGGIDVNVYGDTTVDRLYAAGECSHTGVHGLNRLASNSLLEALVFARRTTYDISRRMRHESSGVTAPAPEKPAGGRTLEPGHRTRIRAIMQKAWFVIPDYDAVESGLKEARAILEDLKTGGYALSADYIEAKSLATVCVIILSEVMRERETPATP